jgi:transposase
MDLSCLGFGAKRSQQLGKSDQIDARAIGRAVLREGVERFPVAFLDEDAMEIRPLCDRREALVNERTRLINRLRINRTATSDKSRRASSGPATAEPPAPAPAGAKTCRSEKSQP